MNIQEQFHKDSNQQHSVTQLRHNTAHMNLKFRQFTYTTALFTATVLLLLMELREQNKMYSAAAFHCTDRQCTVDTVWCWCY